MAVTLYRCSKCRGLFNTVFEPLKMCRDCKLQQTSGGTSRASLRTLEMLDDDSEVTIVEPEETVGGGKAGQAIGGPIGDAQEVFAQQYAQNQASRLGGLMGSGQQGIYSGGSEIRNPFTYSVPDNPEYKFKFIEGMKVPANGQRVYDPNTDSFFYRDSSGLIVRCNGEGVILQVMPLQETIRVTGIDAPPLKPEPESSPHDAILKPSRKMKFAAE